MGRCEEVEGGFDAHKKQDGKVGGEQMNEEGAKAVLKRFESNVPGQYDLEVLAHAKGFLEGLELKREDFRIMREIAIDEQQMGEDEKLIDQAFAKRRGEKKLGEPGGAK